MDGGGENIRGAKLFRLGEDPTDQMSWLFKYYCTIPNPVDPSRRIAVVLWSISDGKGGINQLRASGNQAEVIAKKYMLNIS